jgi:hypothetical protein
VLQCDVTDEDACYVRRENGRKQGGERGSVTLYVTACSVSVSNYVLCLLTSEGAVASFVTESTCSVRPSSENRIPLQRFEE